MNKKFLISIFKNGSWDCMPDSYGDGYFETAKDARNMAKILIKDGITTDCWIRKIFNTGHYKTICAVSSHFQEIA